MTRIVRLAGLALLGAAVTGCVSSEKYAAMKLERDRLVEQLNQADRDAQAARAESAIFKGQLDGIATSAGSKDAQLLNLMKSLNEAQRERDDLRARYEKALASAGTVVLPQGLSNALEAFAQQNPGLVEFDAARGIVKFSSDVTFDTGSAELTAAARTAIARFATILNSAEARGYELHVAGHTDNRPVNSQATISRGHLDNWYLSSHRAIAVGKALQSQGVSAERMAVVGYADQRPVDSNATPAGQQRNRRVEVMILPNQVNARLAGSREAGDGAGATPPINKDAGAVPPGETPPMPVGGGFESK